MSEVVRQAVILVGGFGTRLGDLTRQVPKPLMPIDDERVFLDELIDMIARHGFNDIILLAGHMSEQFLARYDNVVRLGARLRVLVEAEPAGTGGALRLASDYLAPVFLFANGDTLFDVNIRRLDVVLAANSHNRLVGVMALREVANVARYGGVRLEGNFVTEFHEKKYVAADKPGLINAGIGLLTRTILEHIPVGRSSLEVDVYPSLARKGLLGGIQLKGYFIDIGLPETLEEARIAIPARRVRPALFLDRDGVLNHDNGYTHRIEDLQLIGGAARLVRAANEYGALVIVITNQSGVARGFYDLDEVDRFHAALQARLFKYAAHIDAFYVCPYHGEALLPQWRVADHPNRKPNPGLLFQAMQDWPISPTFSVLVGDRESDMEAAKRAGVHGLLFSGGALDALIPAVMSRLKLAGIDKLPKRGWASCDNEGGK